MKARSDGIIGDGIVLFGSGFFLRRRRENAERSCGRLRLSDTNLACLYGSVRGLETGFWALVAAAAAAACAAAIT